MKPFDEMCGDEFIEFYKFMCEEIIATTERLKLSLTGEWFSTAEIFHDHLARKMHTLEELQDELRKRNEAVISDGEDDVEEDDEEECDEEECDDDVCAELDEEECESKYSKMTDAQLAQEYSDSCLGLAESMSCAKRVAFGMTGEAYFNDASAFWSVISGIHKEAEKRGLCNVE